MRRSVRLGAVAVALALALGLCIHQGATYDENWPYRSDFQ
jgi:hypothetical protein